MNISDFPSRTFGDYVFTPCENQFDGGSKVSYWISKRGYVYSAYCFSANDPVTASENLTDGCLCSYITHFDRLLADQTLLNIFRVDYGDILEIELTIAKRMIDDFCMIEYRSAGADFSDLSNVGIAYTNTEDELFPIQVSVDLVDNAIRTKVNDVVVRDDQYQSLADLIINGLRNLDVMNLCCVDEKSLIPIYRDYLTGKNISFNGRMCTISEIDNDGNVILEDFSSITQYAKLDDVTKAYRQHVLSEYMEFARIRFTSVNIDGEKRDWIFANVSSLEGEWLFDDCDLPANDDEISDVIIKSQPVEGISTFEDLLKYVGILANLEEGVECKPYRDQPDKCENH